MATALPPILRTTASRLSALYLLLFAVCAVVLVFYMTSLSARMLTAQTMETINEEASDLGRAYQRGGLPLLVRMIGQRSRQPGANLYLIADASGRILAGNVESPGRASSRRKAGPGAVSPQRYGERRAQPGAEPLSRRPGSIRASHVRSRWC